MDFLQACRNSRELQNKVLTCILDPIIIADLEGRILFSTPNAQDVLGYRPEELSETRLERLFTPEDLQHLYPNLLTMAQKGESFTGELMLLRKDQSRFFASMVWKPFFDQTQDTGIIALCIHDKDKEKTLEMAYNESYYEDMVQIANGIAHEIRNPLMGIGGFVNRIFNSDKIIHDFQKYHDYITEDLQKIEYMVEKVENFASITKPRPSKVLFTELLNEVLTPFREAMKHRKINVSFVGDELTLVVDKNQISTVLTVLISNAMDALTEGGLVTIQNETDESAVRILISDNGHGISPNDLPHIFSPFFSTKPNRVGIDLATAKRIMTGHQGTIEVESKPGRGARFTLLFPLERRRALRISRMS